MVQKGDVLYGFIENSRMDFLKHSLWQSSLISPVEKELCWLSSGLELVPWVVSDGEQFAE